MSEDAKIDAIVSLHEHNIAKDKRIAELERQLAEAQESEGKAWNSRDELLKDRNALLDQTRIGPLRAEEWQIRATRAERQLAEAKEDTARLDFLLGLKDRYRFSVWLTCDGVKKYELWLIKGPLIQSQCFFGETEREAIDAARKEAK